MGPPPKTPIRIGPAAKTAAKPAAKTGSRANVIQITKGKGKGKAQDGWMLGWSTAEIGTRYSAIMAKEWRAIFQSDEDRWERLKQRVQEYYVTHNIKTKKVALKKKGQWEGVIALVMSSSALRRFAPLAKLNNPQGEAIQGGVNTCLVEWLRIIKTKAKPDVVELSDEEQDSENEASTVGSIIEVPAPAKRVKVATRKRQIEAVEEPVAVQFPVEVEGMTLTYSPEVLALVLRSPKIYFGRTIGFSFWYPEDWRDPIPDAGGPVAGPLAPVPRCLCLAAPYEPPWVLPRNSPHNPLIVIGELARPDLYSLYSLIRRMRGDDEAGWYLPRLIQGAITHITEWPIHGTGVGHIPHFWDIITVDSDEAVRALLNGSSAQAIVRMSVIFHELDSTGVETPPPANEAFLPGGLYEYLRQLHGDVGADEVPEEEPPSPPAPPPQSLSPDIPPRTPHKKHKPYRVLGL